MRERNQSPMRMRTVALSVAFSLICSTAVVAHEGKEHVMGTISALDGQHLVVTDREGKPVSINLTKDTKYKQGDAPAAVSALMVGARVVVEVTGKPESFVASEVRFAPAAAAKDHAGSDEAGHDQPHQH